MTNGMKVAVSIPDDVFVEAERVASNLRTSRSSLYARALAEFIERRDPQSITEAMNAVVDEVDEPVDPFVDEAGRQILRRVEW